MTTNTPQPPFRLAPTLNTITPTGKRFNLFAPHCEDSYKLSHRQAYSEGTEYVFSNFTARSSKYLNLPKKYDENKVVWYGIQGTLMELAALWEESFFSKPKEEVLARYAARVPAFASDDKPAYTQHLSNLHDLGYLPIRVKSIVEGSRVNIGIPLVTIVNTLPEFFWLTNALETYLSNESWKAPTVATIAHTYRRILEDFADQTGSPKDFVPWQGHCFADRGMSGMLDAAKTGSAHQTSFLGSDSVSAFDYLDWGYQGNDTFLGGSVNATEHSVMCLDGQDNELETIRRIIGTVHGTGVVSFVADSWDFWRVITEYMPALKDTILGRKRNSIGLSKVVVRPDSGDPADIICGTAVGVSSLGWESVKSAYRKWSEPTPFRCEFKGAYYEVVPGEEFKCIECAPTPEQKGAIACLYETFGGTLTDKGFKMLSDRVGLIYGDSITLERCLDIMQRLKDKGFASSNVICGLGSFSYNFLTRDSLGFAMKATYGIVNGVGQEMVKNPKTDSGVKKSAKGLPKVVLGVDGNYTLLERSSWEQEAEGELQLVFENGNFFNKTTITEIRERIWPTT